MSAVNLHPDFAKAIVAGITDAAAIERAAKRLADSMKAVHGGNWQSTVDHDDHFVLIVRQR
jgi:hypothetical protein